MREGAPSTLQKLHICNECNEGLDTWEIILLKILSVGQTLLILYQSARYLWLQEVQQYQIILFFHTQR